MKPTLYDLRARSEVTAVQWRSDHPEELAEEIVNWINSDGDEIAGYSSTARGPRNTMGESWGLLTLTINGKPYEIYPRDFVVRDVNRRFHVIPPSRFKLLYAPVEPVQ